MNLLYRDWWRDAPLWVCITFFGIFQPWCRHLNCKNHVAYWKIPLFASFGKYFMFWALYSSNPDLGTTSPRNTCPPQTEALHNECGWLRCLSLQWAYPFMSSLGGEGIVMWYRGRMKLKSLSDRLWHAGQSSTMTGTYTGQFVMNGFLDIRMSLWVRITVTRLIAILPTLVVAITYRNSKGTELDVLNEWLNVLNSVQLPFALVPVSSLLSKAGDHDSSRGMPVSVYTL